MRYWTWAEIKDKVQRDLDLEGEVFINETELLGYANEAIDEVERQIHTLYDDYFLTRSQITLVSGQETYDLPADIYANKIRSVIYRNATKVFKVERLRDWHKLEEYEVYQSGTHASVRFGWFLLNSTPGQPQIILAPTPLENGAYVQIWYLRNANTLTVDADILDIPEAANYVMQYIKVRCYEKEAHPMVQKAMQDLAVEKSTTLGTLAGLVADGDNEIESDMSVYNEMS